MSAEPPVDFLERQQWLEPVEAGTQEAVAAVFRGAGRPIRNFLHGTWLGHPLHPMLTDIPLGAWTATLVLDVLDASGRKDCRAGADIALAVGLAGAGCAALAGVADWHVTDGRARRVGLVHGLLNLVGTGLYAASLVARRQRNRGAGRVLAFAGFMVTSAAAYLGGGLVYSKQIGVNHTAGQAPLSGWTGVLNDSDLPEGTPHRDTVNGVGVLLLRAGGRIYCISDVCSHLGGPLAEGEVHGDAVTCPWHGSRFSLRDGSVIDGPATHPQPCFDVRVNQGVVEIRAQDPE
jgi:nitrite reductase/ring-hydroxylating ferredoxin subunit/uncharacterized membrane protein